MEQIFARMWICGRPRRRHPPPRRVRAPRRRQRQHPRGRRRRRASAPFTTSAGIAGRGSARRRTGILSRQHPVSVSRLDLRPRRASDRRAADGRGRGIPQGRLPALAGRVRGVGRPRLHQPRRQIRRRSASQLGALPDAFRAVADGGTAPGSPRRPTPCRPTGS